LEPGALSVRMSRAPHMKKKGSQKPSRGRAYYYYNSRGQGVREGDGPRVE
jgi:hypothetical protein